MAHACMIVDYRSKTSDCNACMVDDKTPRRLSSQDVR